MKNELEELELRAAEPEFWNDAENSQKVLQRTKNLQNKLDHYRLLFKDCEDKDLKAEVKELIAQHGKLNDCDEDTLKNIYDKLK